MRLLSGLPIFLLLISVCLLASCGGTGTAQAFSPTPSPTPQPNSFQLTVSFTGSGTGSVVSTPNGISCRTGNSTGCSVSLASGTSIKLTVTPDANMVFAGWQGGACSGTTPTCTFAISDNTNLIVDLNQAPPPPPAAAQITVVESGGGSGTVVSAPAGINCPGSCSAAFSQGTQITLTATAAQNSAFGGFSGACSTQRTRARTKQHKEDSSPSPTCSFTATGSQSITAAFTTLQQPPPPPPTSSISITINGKGTVMSDPAGINCPGTCSASFPQGTNVTINANANVGWQFNGWTGGCSTEGLTCQLTIAGSQSLSATFVSLDLTYNGGPILPTTTTQAIFWGLRWSDSSFVADKITGMDSWYEGISGSSYAGSVDEYTDAAGDHVTATSNYLGHLIDTSAASDSGAITEACTLIKNPVPNQYVAVYLDEPRPGNACAWHTYTTCTNNPNQQLEVAVVYNLDGDGGCDPGDTETGHSQGLAAIANVSGHEFSESRTDPQFTAWFNLNGEETGDLCDFLFTDPFVTFSNGSRWKIQANWSNYANDNGLGQINGGCVDFNITGK